MVPTGSELKLCCVNCEKAIDEIGQLTWVLRHESVIHRKGTEPAMRWGSGLRVSTHSKAGSRRLHCRWRLVLARLSLAAGRQHRCGATRPLSQSGGYLLT